MIFRRTKSIGLTRLSIWLGLAGLALNAQTFADAPVSYFKDVEPILTRSCQGCHNPTKADAELDLTTYAAFAKGGKTDKSFEPGHPENSLLMDMISGENPPMPKKADPLPPAEVELIKRWILEGAKDDTPADGGDPINAANPPVYMTPPTITSLAFSPDGTTLAVSGYHEVLLHRSDGEGKAARLVGAAPRIESLAFSPDGKLLAVSGGSPVQYGEIQVWDVAAKQLKAAYRFGNDTLYGVSFSPDGKKLAFGSGTGHAVRMISVDDGKELLKFENHSDWVLGTAFNMDGTRLVSGGRDQAVKLINATSGQFIDDINNPLEAVICLARHPIDNVVAYGGDMGTPRLYRISDNQQRTAGRNDTNLVRALDRQPGPVHATAFNPDGALLAVGGAFPEVKVFNTATGAQTLALKGHEGSIFALAYHPQGAYIASGGFDGKVRLYNPASGELVKAFDPVTLIAKEKILEALGDVAAEEVAMRQDSQIKPSDFLEAIK